MGSLYNRQERNTIRKRLRNCRPKPERVLWQYLRKRQVMGIKFRRQFSVGPFVLDFYSPQVRIAIEVDGNSHFSKSARRYDQRRTRYLSGRGIRVLRVTNDRVMSDVESVLRFIRHQHVRLTPTDSPLERGRSVRG